jgi:hypothetical protein
MKDGASPCCCLHSCCLRFEADRDKGDFSDLPELHALSSGLKATCTAITAGETTEHLACVAHHVQGVRGNAKAKLLAKLISTILRGQHPCSCLFACT